MAEQTGVPTSQNQGQVKASQIVEQVAEVAKRVDAVVTKLDALAATRVSAAPSHEAVCIIFGRVWDTQGNEYSVTLREGATTDDLDGLLETMSKLPVFAAKHGFTTNRGAVSGQPIPAMGATGATHQTPTLAANGAAVPPVAGAAAPAQNQAPAASEYEQLGKLVISGKVPNPIVEMYSANTNLKWPIAKAPASVIGAIINKHYPGRVGDTSFLEAFGATYNTNWRVRLVTSQRNPKWKDVDDIICPELETA